MTQSWNSHGLRKSVLATLIGLAVAQSGHALKPMSDESLSETTGEGIALLPEDFKMVFQGANDVSKGSSYALGLANPSSYDTGFIRIIPTGENYDALTSATKADLDKRRTKADIFIYGLALSKSNDDLNQRYSNTGFNWGTTANPWLFRAGTQNTQQFNSAAGNVGYLALEAPLATVDKDEADNVIKQGFWLDAFSRSWGSANTLNPITGAPIASPVSGDPTNDTNLDKNQRIRLQYVANGLSLNGTQLRLFQTMGSSNADYNKTLGMAAILRINTNDDPSGLIYEDTEANRKLLGQKGIRIGTAAKDDQSDGTYSTPALDGSKAPLFHATEGVYLYSPNVNLVLGNMYQPYILSSEGNNIALEVTRIPNVPAIYKKIYTFYDDAEISTGNIAANTTYYKVIDGKYTPGLDISNANRYNKGTDGKYTASTTGSYVRVGNSYVQLEMNGTAFKAYSSTDLTNLKKSYEGSTCNVASCGTNGASITAGTVTTKYQGTNATHSSISVGSVALDPVTNLLKAKTDANSTGVVFRGPTGNVNLGSAAIDGVLIQHLKFKTTGL
ncbi:hypothetical protein [Acinetobacter sp. WCHAc010052]|uniref:hypothetical protein n=1 Tax=Acinetobacter sp. WCHAc010052 TaxID=2004647 RepID=UPI00196ADCDF|nr:hypothetical protein [Acinetobacter sp. WCHAc010052]